MKYSKKNACSLFVRADAGGFTGTGHVMRMLALAQAYQRRGGKVTFICAQLPDTLEERLVQEGCEVIRIAAKSGSQEDARATLAVVQGAGSSSQPSTSSASLREGTRPRGQGAGVGSEEQNPPSSIHHSPLPLDKDSTTPNTWLVVDGYHFGFDYQKAIKASGLSLLCTDDFGYSERWCCDAILNQNLDAEKSFIYDNEIADSQALLGASFCLFREEFLEEKEISSEWGAIHRLLITLGGSDPENATEATLRLLTQACERPLEIRVLAGADNPHIESLRTFTSQHSIEVIQNARNMPEQYAWADGIISAGGSTCWEWLYLGLPGAIVTIADNQLPIVHALTEERKAALPLGWFNSDEFKDKNTQLSAWADDPGSVCCRDQAQSLIDGNGADRVITSLLLDRLFFRRACIADVNKTWEWANDSLSRKMSFTQNEIEFQEHLTWWTKQLANCCSWIRIIEDGDHFEPCGIVRFELFKTEGYAVISINIDPNARGKGYGLSAISEGTKLYGLCSSVSKIHAYIRPKNLASLKAFEKAGYHIAGTEQIKSQDAICMIFDCLDTPQTPVTSEEKRYE
ncbi:MAG TPA: UDP-2,4-diacetamido-2,4,6-trideoxy-beta-L-altropyranose hydrolase [Opitutae bacterium]|nr:UDP-2,4-diacetamido-2,4,6-trideoxy-beta-L-altropyranose hydrolase [Opitutae bacterium]